MAGNYADVPGPRMAYHRDGSVGFTHTGGGISTLSGANMIELNDEDSSGTGNALLHNDSFGAGMYVGVVFPELRDLAGWFVYAPSGNYNGTSFETSVDSTNGLDGTWVNHSTPGSGQYGVASQPGYRTNIQTVSLTGKKAVRFHSGQSGGGATVDFITMHLYGPFNAAATRYLAVTDTGGTEVTGAHFDFDDDPRGGVSETIQFRVKNLNGSLTASTITVGLEVNYDKSPSFLDDYELSDDGVSYGSTVSIASLAPAATSSTLYLRRTTPIGAQMGLESGVVTVSAASWA